MIRLYRPLFISRYIYRGALFRIKSTEKFLCLTFDDGPYSGSTERILEVLRNSTLRLSSFVRAVRLPQTRV